MDSVSSNKDEEKLKEEQEKNWCDLPPEIKLVCVKWMDFETRWNLRCTSSMEKVLIENEKCPDVKLSIGNPYSGSIYPLNPYKIIVRPSQTKFRFELDPTNRSTMAALLRMADIDFLQVGCDTNIFQALREFAEKSPFETDSLCLVRATKNDLPILNKCTGLDYVEINFKKEEKVSLAFVMKNADFESISKTRRIKLQNIHSVHPVTLIRMIKRWIADKRDKYTIFELKMSNTRYDLESVFNQVWDRFEERVEDIGRDDTFYISMRDDLYIKCKLDRQEMRIQVTDHRELVQDEEEVEMDWDDLSDENFDDYSD